MCPEGIRVIIGIENRKVNVHTRKKVIVDPASKVPYEISLWSAKSSTESIGAIILSTVRKAARLAVYDEMIINVKNHHIPPTIRVDAAYLLCSAT